mgnify:CR=1 FL=1
MIFCRDYINYKVYISIDDGIICEPAINKLSYAIKHADDALEDKDI